MKALRLGPVEMFPFVEAPDQRRIRDGYETLHELGAIDDEDNLTPMGRDLARMPIDPRLARMVVAAREEDCLEEVLVIASALSVQDPRDRPHDKRDAADEAHAKFADPTSDFLTLLNIWNFYREQSEKLSRSRLGKACIQSYLSLVRLREWQDVHRQLRDLVRELGYKPNAAKATPEKVHRALLTGLLGNVGVKGERHEFNGCRGAKFHVFPGSVLFSTPPKWVVAGELVSTTRLYARTCAAIEPEWIEELGSHLVTKSHSDPRWESKYGKVLADEKVTLFGLTIVPKRTVHFGPVDPVESRRLFIIMHSLRVTCGAICRFLSTTGRLSKRSRICRPKRVGGICLLSSGCGLIFTMRGCPGTCTARRRSRNGRRSRFVRSPTCCTCGVRICLRATIRR